MVSAQDHQLVHLPTLTRALMAMVEHDVLHGPRWRGSPRCMAGEHPHVHLLMRGVDATGQEVHFTHDYRLAVPALSGANPADPMAWRGGNTQPTSRPLDAWADAHLKETQLHD